MNKFNGRKNEQGSVLVEVIAVIALLGVMGPLLFRQVMTRNEEVENINVASEMRTLKEGLSAFILSEKERLLRDFGSGSDCMSANQFRRKLQLFLPYGNETVTEDGGYNFYICKNSDNFLQGYIVPTEDAIPSGTRFKRAARIANLIGADAGICQGGYINGVAGGWWMDDPGGWCTSAGGNVVYIATTGMDTFVPEVTFEDYSASLVALPDKLALQDLHAWNYFSVGHTNENCYTLGHNQTGNYSAEKGYTASNDTIYDAGSNGGRNNKCDPLFWVGSTSGADKAKGNVYVKNNLMVGRATDGTEKQAIGLFHSDSASANSTYNETASEGNKIVVYDNAGKEKIIINGKGEIIARDPKSTSENDNTETMTMTNQGLKSSKKAPNANENYKVDPAYTSVMNDIKLDSRGGARLSEILPNYISRAVHEISNTNTTVPIPSCPTHYAPAVIVTPTSWGDLKVQKSDVANKLTVSNSQVTASADIPVANSGLKITIDSTEGAHHKNGSNSSTGNWTIKFTSSGTSSTNGRTDVKGLAQTYCVYDNSTPSVPDSRERSSNN